MSQCVESHGFYSMGLRPKDPFFVRVRLSDMLIFYMKFSTIMCRQKYTMTNSGIRLGVRAQLSI
jgi:hypothetical protein